MVWVIAVCVMVLGAGVASSQNFPNKPIRIVTSEAGGGNDVQARLIAQGLTGGLREQVMVENRPSGIIPGDIVSNARPNGYTLLLYNNALWTGPLIQATPYDAIKDFSPIVAVAKAANVLVVNPALPIHSVAELIAVAKAKPGELNYGSSGTGASNHLAAELFRTMAGINVVRINYKGAGPALTALLAGEIHLMFPTAGAGAPPNKNPPALGVRGSSAPPPPPSPRGPNVPGPGVPRPRTDFR